MSNMSYCRFRNTENDLYDCIEHMDDDLNGDEFDARNEIIKMAKQIVENYGEATFVEKSEDEEE